MIYPDNFEYKTGFDRIRELLREKCLSSMGLDNVDAMSFSGDFETISLQLALTYEFQNILQFEDSFPDRHYYKISDLLSKLRVEGTFPEPGEVFDLKRSLETVKSVLHFFRSREGVRYPALTEVCKPVKTYPYVIDAIDRIIDKKGIIKDSASPRLKEIRAELAGKNMQASKRLQAIFKQAQAEGLVDADTTVSMRNGRGVIPVSVYDKRKIKGLIHDRSASGKTVFIEPEEIVEINNDIVELEYEEKREIVKIMMALADDIRPYIDDLIEAGAFLGKIDFIRAKALLGVALNSIKPGLNTNPIMLWRKAVHPLLFISFGKTPGRRVEPLNIELDGNSRIALISGPNAGGKSVCLKTVGLLQYMLQCGMTIPVGEGTEAGIFKKILIDIGDEQSIENDLSTYSSHLLNMKAFLKNSDASTLVLIDEFGTGTEPMLGGAIAEAILGELNRKKAYGVITTHYANLKHFASITPGIVNGAMAFDNHLMQPLFQLSLGKPGSSFAFEIARKIGLPEDILAIASEKAGVENISYDKHLKDIARDKRYWETKRQNIRHHEKRLEELIAGYETELAGTQSLRKEIISGAKREAQKILDDSNRIIENTIRSIKESQAEKERTREERRRLEQFKTEMLTPSQPELPASGEQKIASLHQKARKIKLNRIPAAKPEQKAGMELPLKPGDAVRMTETMAAGEIVSIKGKTAEIETGYIRMRVPLDKIERISRRELRRNTAAPVFYSEPGTVISTRAINFSPEISIRGMRAQEALDIVRDLIDNAVVVRHRHLRILHGKGNGILRQLVREYLKASGVVKSFRDEHVEFGGAGITVVEMDV
ncbi:MAG: Smr/MutS family protein [Bacteroidales bacterium]|jgi:DNA mismatch repair protein MutS2|nr:Smr/MutS family protein [Bacteroidales bacterium]